MNPTDGWVEHIIAADVIGPMSLDVVDMDQDGDQDVVVGEHNLADSSRARMLVFENVDGKGKIWTQHTVYTGDEHHDGAHVVDIDDDGDFDILSIGWKNPNVLIYENVGGSCSVPPQPTIHTLTTNVSGDGKITKKPDQITYATGDVVTLEAVADPGWLFSGWSGAADGNQNPLTLTMDADKTITATFIQEQGTIYSLTTNVSGSGNITRKPDQVTYTAGDVVTLEAVADPGWLFSGWSGAADGNQNPLTVTMDADKTITASLLRNEEFSFLFLPITGSGESATSTENDVDIDTKPADPSNSASAAFTFASIDGTATFSCDLDGGGYSACTSPKNYTGLSDGSHTVSVRAIGAGGNTGTPATYTWIVDTTAPDVSIDTRPTDPSNSASAAFTFSSTDGSATFSCELDGGGYSACSSPKNYTGLSDGSHTVSVRATDSTGNTGTQATYTWIVDITAPDVSGRVMDGLRLLYTFSEGAGSSVRDMSGIQPVLNLDIENDDAVRWTENGLAIEAETLISSRSSAAGLVDACQATGEITIEAWVKPGNITQQGPARIVTLSKDTNARNFTLEQGLWGIFSPLRTMFVYELHQPLAMGQS